MADVWFRKIGFGRNPFSIKPAAFRYELFGVDPEPVLSGVDNGKIMFVEAPPGYGKTTLLKSIINRFGGKGKVVYAHAISSQSVDIKGLLKRSSLANYITGNVPSGMVLVVDEAQNLTPESGDEILEFFRNGNLRAVVFFGTSYWKGAFPSGLLQLVNGNVLSLSKPTPEQAISLVRARIGNIPLLSNNSILEAYRKAGGNPRRLLQICEDECRASVEVGPVAESVSFQVQPASAVIPSLKRRRGAIRRRRPIVAASVSGVALKQDVSTAAIGEPDSVEVLPSSIVRKRASRKVPVRRRKPVARLQTKGRKAAKQPSSPVSVASSTVHADGSEGSYWGGFMGMQK